MILFINPNQYKHPPVPPIGLEYLAGHLNHHGHQAAILDLCFSTNPEADLVGAIDKYRPDIAGITIRQVDTTLFDNNEFFLGDIKKMVQYCQGQGLEVILGGAGFATMPSAIMDYTGADYGIYGPGGKAMVRFMDKYKKGEAPDKLTNGFDFYTPGQSYNSYRNMGPYYQEYIKQGGVAGFNTQTGCRGKCLFCTEQKKAVFFIQPTCVAKEIKTIQQAGVDRFHLCDSEFNQDLGHCIDVCKAIYHECGPIDWALYMKPRPYSSVLFEWLALSGASLITLSIDSLNEGPGTFSEVENFFKLAEKNGIKVAVDLSVGLPGEAEGRLLELAAFLKNQPCGTVGVNATYRVYPAAKLYDYVSSHFNIISDKLTGYNPGCEFISPVFYNHVAENVLRDIFQPATKFRIEGKDKAVNYQRV